MDNYKIAIREVNSEQLEKRLEARGSRLVQKNEITSVSLSSFISPLVHLSLVLLCSAKRVPCALVACALVPLSAIVTVFMNYIT